MQDLPKAPPAEWMMVGFSCSVQEITLGGQKMKAMIFWHVNSPESIRFIFPIDDAGARTIGNQLLDRPAIFVPEVMPKANGNAQ